MHIFSIMHKVLTVARFGIFPFLAILSQFWACRARLGNHVRYYFVHFGVY